MNKSLKNLISEYSHSLLVLNEASMTVFLLLFLSQNITCEKRSSYCGIMFQNYHTNKVPSVLQAMPEIRSLVGTFDGFKYNIRLLKPLVSVIDSACETFL